ncbi:transcriptional regulator OPI1 [Sugiyamaella lignohabitans]|uniref:Transcriptional regulator OPI1 n=1 Tax=Sugiyamaella lignohabitans TaxID=796027 RepID=A0A170QXI3_9ASCO|nr:transcriptional regulator OPI1 [Sugiyamaella lignohabitans]ANB15943.1 transcriptional regulator OPI1 [Sugiyamaella lignohabitans]
MPSQEDQLAAEVLESLRDSARTSVSPPPPPRASANSNPTSSLLTKVSSHPLVSSAVNIYNSSKSYSPRFKYSAEKIEAVIIPKGDRREKDRDRNKEKEGSISGSSTPNSSHTISTSASSSSLASLMRTSSTSSTTSNPSSGKPKWRRVLVTATSLASLSSESRQRLRYCLRFLKLANAHLASKVNMLQELLDEEAAHAMAQQIASNHVPADRKPPKKYTIAAIKQDIITTVKKVVTVVSNFAGNSLPEPARTHVRNYILRLPAKWALTLSHTPRTPLTPGTPGTPRATMMAASSGSAWATGNATRATGAGFHKRSTSGYEFNGVGSESDTESVNARSGTAESEASPDLKSPGAESTAATSIHLTEEQVAAARAANLAHSDVEIGGRVLSLARESLLMLDQITSIVDETLEKAESWCEKLGRSRRKHVTGENKDVSLEQDGEPSDDEFEEEDSMSRDEGLPGTSAAPTSA